MSENDQRNVRFFRSLLPQLEWGEAIIPRIPLSRFAPSLHTGLSTFVATATRLCTHKLLTLRKLEASLDLDLVFNFSKFELLLSIITRACQHLNSLSRLRSRLRLRTIKVPSLHKASKLVPLVVLQQTSGGSHERG